MDHLMNVSVSFKRMCILPCWLGSKVWERGGLFIILKLNPWVATFPSICYLYFHPLGEQEGYRGWNRINFPSPGGIKLWKSLFLLRLGLCCREAVGHISQWLLFPFQYQNHEGVILIPYHENLVGFLEIKPTKVHGPS